MHSNTNSTNLNSWRKWIGVIWLLVEMNLISANIFGLPALFKVLPKYGIYNNYCQSSINATEQDCTGQTQQYQVNIFFKYFNFYCNLFVCFRMP
jgi:hypothetical protein